MFCTNCGKEIPNGTNFCNYCGAAQNNNSAQNTQSTYQTGETQYSSTGSQQPYAQPHSQKNKGNLKVIIPIAIVVVIVAFVIGYFATGANKVKQPMPFDTPAVQDPVDLPSPTVKQDTTDASDLTDGKQCKTFVISNDVARIYTKFFYGDDGIVQSISGAITVEDTTMVEANYLDDLRGDAETASGMLQEMGANNTSYVMVTDDTANNKYSETYLFGLLDEDANVASLAANFIGFEAESGRITIDKAEEEMLGFGFTLQ